MISEKLTKSIKTAWRVMYDFIDITDRRHIFLLSAGIAFNQLLCMIPLTILVLSIVGGFVEEAASREAVRGFLVQVLPANIEATNAISTVLTELGIAYSYKTLTGWIAGIALLWLASALFSSLRTGLNAIFHIPTPKFFVLYKLKDMALTIVTAILVLITTALSPMLTLFEDMGNMQLYGFTVRVLSLAATTILFFFLYRVVPNRKLPWQVVVMSTMTAVALWEIARVAFSWYVNSAANFSKFYGGYVALASLALWFYYSAFIFLLSAELAQYIHVSRTEHKSPEV